LAAKLVANFIFLRGHRSFLFVLLQELMEDINLQTLRGMWFQHDGALAHCAGVVRDYSNERFFQRWIGKTNIFFFNC